MKLTSQHKKKHIYFHLDKEQYEKLIHQYGNKKVIHQIIQILSTYEFPYADYYLSQKDIYHKYQLLKDFHGVWSHQPYEIKKQEQTLNPLPILFQNKYMLYIPNNEDYMNIGILTNAFTERSRMKCFRQNKNMKTYSFYDGWKKKDMIKDCVHYLIHHHKNINAYELRESIYMITRNPKYKYTECAHENICFLKMVFQELQKIIHPLPFTVLDACAGWGDRLLVCMSLNVSKYIGIDPNSESYIGFQKMIKMFRKEKTCKMLLDGFPEVTFPNSNELFSICFLSPPSFDSEMYSSNEKQSILLYKNNHEWMIHFLFQTIQICWSKIHIGGVFVIQSILAPKINTYIQYFCKGSQFLGCLSIKTGKHRNKPLWVWKKNETNQKIKINGKHINQMKKIYSEPVIQYLQHEMIKNK